MREIGFLSEVLATQEESLIVDIKQKVPIVTSQIGKLKYEVIAYLEGENDFPVPRNIDNKLLKQANNLNHEMDQLTEKIVEVSKRETDQAVIDIDNLKTDLQESVYALKLATQLVNITQAFKKIDEFNKASKFLEAAKQVDIASNIISEIPKDEQLDIVKTVIINLTFKREEILSEVTNKWKEAVIISEELTDTENFTIKIDNRTHDLNEIMQVLYYEQTTRQFNLLAKCLLNNILIPIINNTVELNLDVKDNFEILEIKVKPKSEKMKYNDVFENLQTVFSYLCGLINFSLEKDLLFLRYIGNKIRESFCEEFIKNCLADAVPSTQEGLEKYKTVVKDIEDLQLTMTECGFFDEKCSQILEYAGNVDVLFANKVCKNYTDKANVIFKKDLHDIIEVGVDINQCAENQKINDFPKCYVSRSACELLNLARTILDQAAISTDMCAGRLIYTSKQIFELYCIVVPECHKKLLETIPQQVALFHNNCIYLAHELITYNKYYDEKISIAFAGDSFNYEIAYLRKAGTDAFLKYMRSQIKQIQDILDESELARLQQIQKLDPNTEKSVRQCLRQLELLKTVWQKVLTYEIYNKTIGELLNSFVDHLIRLILAVEDISADTCTLLVEMFKIVQTRGPKLFTEPKEINMYTKHWYKFNELILLLNSKLSDINDRWADGKGPLAVEYSPEEIKRLIRALFQNTDLRAAVLDKIN